MSIAAPEYCLVGCPHGIVQGRGRQTLWYAAGIILNITGSFLAIIGLFSREWVLLTRGTGMCRGDIGGTGIACSGLRFGIWKACTSVADTDTNGISDVFNGYDEDIYSQRCWKSWEVVPGVDETWTLWAQAIAGVAASGFLTSLLATSCSVLTRKMVDRGGKPSPNHVIQWLHRMPLVECASALASIATILVLLVFGHLKRSVIKGQGQTAGTGSGFWLTLAGFVLTVIGTLIMTFNRMSFTTTSAKIRHSKQTENHHTQNVTMTLRADTDTNTDNSKTVPLYQNNHNLLISNNIQVPAVYLVESKDLCLNAGIYNHNYLGSNC